MFRVRQVLMRGVRYKRQSLHWWRAFRVERAQAGGEAMSHLAILGMITVGVLFGVAIGYLVGVSR